MLEMPKYFITLGCFSTWVGCIIHTIHWSLSPVPHGGWMGFTDPPDCPAVLSQLHANSLEVMGFEVSCPASPVKWREGKSCGGLSPPISHSEWGTWAVLGCQLWRPSHSSHGLYTASISISYLCKIFFLLLSNFISPNTKKSWGCWIELVFCTEVGFGILSHRPI